jgi:hypothetical protein
MFGPDGPTKPDGAISRFHRAFLKFISRKLVTSLTPSQLKHFAANKPLQAILADG